MLRALRLVMPNCIPELGHGSLKMKSRYVLHLAFSSPRGFIWRRNFPARNQYSNSWPLVVMKVSPRCNARIGEPYFA